MIISGKAFVFGDTIDTDQIYPGRYLELTAIEEMALHAMEGADPAFSSQVQEGDLIVAGKNFGCGSSREHAVLALLGCRVGAVLASSFGRIFYRNAINLGLPLLTWEQEVPIEQGSLLRLDLEKGTLTIEGGVERPLGEEHRFMKEIAEHRGMINLYKERGSLSLDLFKG